MTVVGDEGDGNLLKFGQTNEDYHASVGVSKSQLDVFSRSPHHYWWQYKSGEAPARKESAAMRQGTIVHCAILEPERFEKDYILGDFPDKRTKAYKEFAAEQKAVGLDVLTPSEYNMAMRCRDSVMANCYAKAALSEGEAEVSAYAHEPEADHMYVRSRFDWLAPGAIVDLKTTIDAGPGFGSSVRKYRYHLQAAMYSRVAELNDVARPDFVFIAVERDFPYGVGVYELSNADFSNGLHMYWELTKQLVDCERNNIWPGYTTGVETLQAFTK